MEADEITKNAVQQLVNAVQSSVNTSPVVATDYWDWSMGDGSPIVDGYLAIWNETDTARRRALIDETWSADGRYTDPVFVSGYTGDTPLGGTDDPMTAFLAKPFDGDELLREVRSTLDAAKARQSR